MTFKVFITTAAKQRIREHAEWIATEQAGPQVAADWLTRIGVTIDQLNEMPRRHPVAAEDGWCDYEVRKVTIGQYLIFFTILEDAQACSASRHFCVCVRVLVAPPRDLRRGPRRSRR